MATIEVTWLGKRRFVGVDSTHHSVVLSSADDIGVKPSETLLIALASCGAYDVVSILEKQRVDLISLHVQVDGEQAADPPWPFRRIHLRFRINAPTAQQAQLDRAVDLAINKYCSVRASLSSEIEITYEAELTTATASS